MKFPVDKAPEVPAPIVVAVGVCHIVAEGFVATPIVLFKYINWFVAVILLTYTTSIAQFKKVRGSENVTTKTHSTSDYHKVDLVGFMDVKLEKGTEGTITVKTDDNIHEYVSIESNKGVLKIKIKNNINSY